MKHRIPRKLKKILKGGGWKPWICRFGHIHIAEYGYSLTPPRRYWRVESWSRWRRDQGCW